MRSASMLVALAACSGVKSVPEDMRVVAAGLLRPADVAAGGGYVYVVEQIEVGNEPMYDIKAVRTDGSDFPRSVDAGHVIMALAADDSGAYWIDASVGACTVKMYDGAQARTLGTPASGTYCTLRNIAIGSDAVYVSDDLGQLWRVPKSGSGAVALATTDTSAGSVAVAGDGVWLSTLHGVKHVTFAGAASPEVVLTAASPPDALAYDGNMLYAVLSSGPDGSIVRVDNAQATPLGSVTQPFQLVALGGTLYGASSGGTDGIWTIAETGGDMVVLHDQALYAGIAVDASGVYWAEPSSGQLLGIAR